MTFLTMAHSFPPSPAFVKPKSVLPPTASFSSVTIQLPQTYHNVNSFVSHQFNSRRLPDSPNQLRPRDPELLLTFNKVTHYYHAVCPVEVEVGKHGSFRFDVFSSISSQWTSPKTLLNCGFKIRANVIVSCGYTVEIHTLTEMTLPPTQECVMQLRRVRESVGLVVVNAQMVELY